MNDRIYQITSSPLSPDEYIMADSFINHWFVGYIADYVSDNVNRREDIAWLHEWLEKRGVLLFNDDNSFTILPDGKRIYFMGSHARFLQAVREASNINLSEFINPESANIMDNINKHYCEKYSTYVSSDELDFKPFDEFMRSAEVGKRYYIGGIVNYRY